MKVFLQSIDKNIPDILDYEVVTSPWRWWFEFLKLLYHGDETKMDIVEVKKQSIVDVVVKKQVLFQYFRQFVQHSIFLGWGHVVK